MKERILKGWTVIRALYLAMGIVIIIQSAMQREWLGLLFGAYFASMGIFRFGCAGGNCFGGNCDIQTVHPSKTENKNVEFEEVKTK